MRSGQRTALLGGLVICFAGAALNVLAQGGSAPPRSTADILAILDEYQPDPQKIQRLREIASRQPPTSQDPIDQRNFYVARARAEGGLGMVAQQTEDLRKAYALTARGDINRLVYGFELAIAEFQAGDYLAGLKRYETYASEAANDGQRLSTLTVLASVHAQLGDLPRAREALKHAESAIVSLQTTQAWVTWSNTWQSLLMRARAQVHRYEGKYGEAEAEQRRGIQLWERVIDEVAIHRRFVDVTLEGRVQSMMFWEVHHLVPILLEQGKYADAELVARDSLRRVLKTFGRYAPETGMVIVRLAATVFEQGRFEEAAALGRAAEDIYLKINAAPYSAILAEARRWTGESLSEQGRYAEAVQAFDAMRGGLKQNPSGVDEPSLASPAWIHGLVRAGRAAEAVSQARDYYAALGKRYGDQLYATHEAHGFYALALAANGQKDEALREFRAAVPALLAVASERAGQEGLGLARARRLARILEAYVALLGGFAAEAKSPDGIDPAAEAFRLADVARASSVQRALTAASARAAIRDPELAKLAREEQDVAQRVGSLLGILVDLLSRPPEKRPEGVIEAMRSDVEALRKRRAALRQEIEKRFPDYANLIDPKPVLLEAARARLAPGEALIVLYGTEDRTFVWALPREGAVRFHAAALGRAERDQLVATLRRALDVGDVTIAGFPKFDLAAAHRLYTALLAPVEAAWGSAQSLLVVPHGSLAQLPFALLVTRPSEIVQGSLPFEGYKSVDWLLRRAAVTQLPSVNTLVSLRSVERARAPASAFVGFGDPIFSKQQSERREPVQVAARGIRLRNLAIEKVPSPPQGAAPSKIVANSSTLAQLAPLPDTAQEISEIAAALKADMKRDVFLGAQASEKNVKTANLRDRRIVAFATHGLVPGDLDGLTQPALALSAPEVTGNADEDGLLAMDEILGLELNADWVVLSACNTASPDGSGTEAISGLGKAFFYAGARALLVSNWPVETVSARMLTTDLFRRQAESPGLARAEALRQAMLALLTGPGALDASSRTPLYSYSHPMFWAPFSLVGDGGR